MNSLISKKDLEKCKIPKDQYPEVFDQIIKVSEESDDKTFTVYQTWGKANGKAYLLDEAFETKD